MLQGRAHHIGMEEMRQVKGWQAECIFTPSKVKILLQRDD